MSEGGHIAILGAGNLGTALAWLLARNGHPCIKIWDRFPAVVEAINRHRVNARYLPGIELPESIEAVSSGAHCVAGAGLIIVALPSPFVSATLREVVQTFPPGAVVLSGAKGLTCDLAQPIHCEIQQIVGSRPLVLLAGPAIANEFSRGLPTSVLLASREPAAAQRVQAALQNDFFRLGQTSDVMGAALGGILKNIYAILLGYLDAVGGGGRNLEAAALNAAVKEMATLACAKGAQPGTIYGLAGLGDLVATGFSEDSHNRTYGRELGRGMSPAQLAVKIPLAPEGARAVVAADAWAAEAGIHVPLATAVNDMLRGSPPELAELLRHF